MNNQNTQEYLKRDHLKQKITGINFLWSLNRLKIFLVIIFPILSSCDFRIPQEWETPSWIFDLTIPLINEEYSMASIASSSNDIEIAPPDSSDFIIQLKEEVIDSGAVITEPSFFIIPGNEMDFSFDPIIVPSQDIPDIPSYSEEITISEFIDIEGAGCIPQSLPEGINDTMSIPIGAFCDDLGDVECLELINWLTIGEGNNTLSINNEFPKFV